MSNLYISNGENTSDLSAEIGAMVQALGNASELLATATENVILPLFGRHFDAAGLHSRSGRLRSALTERGASGNVLDVVGDTVVVGVSYEQHPYFEYALEGRPAVSARRARALRIEVDGRVIYRKRAKAAPARPVVFVTQADVDAVAQEFSRLVEAAAR